MSGSRRNDDKEKEEDNGGWASTFFKVAGAAAATAAVAGGLYSLLKQPQSEVAPFTVQNNREEEEVILTVDGSLLRKIPSAGCGGFLTNSSGAWISGFAQKLNPNLREDETEKEAILRGLLWVKGKGERKVTVKNDNKPIVDLVNSERRSNDPLICGIRDLLKRSNNWQAELILISGGENGVADRLAHKAHSLTSFDLHEFDHPPQNCVSLLQFN